MSIARASAATGAPKIGPSIVLKVMAGDRFNVRVSSWHKLNGATPPEPVSPLSELLTALSSGIGRVASGKAIIQELGSSGVLSSEATAF